MSDPKLLTATDVAEDAAAYLLDPDRVMLFTTDYFTPVVDDPYRFGQIGAANAFSDIYAMGGKPALALNLMNFPLRTHRPDEMVAILAGGANKAVEAGCTVAGGHTIDDAEPKYGMAVVGFAHPGKLIRKGGAKPGDLLVLTKPLGTGVLATAFKNDALSADEYEPAVAWMTRLNRHAGEAALEAGLSGGTDVTGFGLLGHLLEMCQQASVSAFVYYGTLPFHPHAERLAKEGWVPGGTLANRDCVAPHTDLPQGLPEHNLLLAADAQTSGGLLLAVPPIKMPGFAAAMRGRGQEHWVIGEVSAGPARITLRE